MNWDSLLTKKRYGRSEEGFNEAGRSGFEKDYDRLVFSPAFRRLQGKTQVHPLPVNDHIHNRLTHTLEVSAISRTLGARVGNKLKERDLLPESSSPSEIGQICKAAALAHDIGNPPFGHACEHAIGHWFSERIERARAARIGPSYKLYQSMSEEEKRDITFFDGNAQGFRIITKLEHFFHDGGMRLSYPVLGTFLKYPWTPQNGPVDKKSSCFYSESDTLKDVCEELGLPKVAELSYRRHPLAHLVEAADDICYRIIDIEDAIEMGILNFGDYQDLLQSIGGNKKIDQENLPPGRARRKFFELRGRIFDKLLSSTSDSFFRNYEDIMSGDFLGDLIKKNDDDTSNLLWECSKTAKERIFTENKKTMLEIGVYENINIILGTFVRAVEEHVQSNFDGTEASPLSKRVVGHVTSEGFTMPDTLYECLRGVTDYVSGMTDRYSSYVAKNVAGVGIV